MLLKQCDIDGKINITTEKKIQRLCVYEISYMLEVVVKSIEGKNRLFSKWCQANWLVT